MEGLMDGSNDIRHVGDEIRLAGDKCVELRKKGLVLICFVHL